MTNRSFIRRSIALFFLVSILAGLRIPEAAYAKLTANTPLSDRSISVAVEYPGVQLSKADKYASVSMDIILQNKGKSDEKVTLWIDKSPEGWDAKIKNASFGITGIFVPADTTKTVRFEAKPNESVRPGKYEFLVKSQTADGRLTMSEPVTVEMIGKESNLSKSKEIKLTTSYPEIKGASNASFEFAVEVDNNQDEPAVYDLFAKGPKDWDINFKSGYEDRSISSLRLKSRENKSLDIEVKPAYNAQAGKYPIEIQVSTATTKAVATVYVILTGTYDLDVRTRDGLLSLDAGRGTPANVSFYVKNTGSAKNNDIKFVSFKPENWKVEFKPDKIESIEPGDMKQVEMTITPNKEALVGDYSLNISVEGEKVKKNLEFRTTVKASAAWGWIGIGIIGIVIFGLMGLFRWLGRR